MFIPYGNSIEYFSGIQVESTTIYSIESMDSRRISHYITWTPWYSTSFHMDSTLLHMDSMVFHIISHGFHMDSILFHIDFILFHIILYGFHIDSTHFQIESQAIIKCSLWGHQTNLVFYSVHCVRSHDFPKPVKIFKSMTFKIITHYVYIYYISKKKH